jgi:bifunctional non-homologous end joining protein LigD
VAPPAGPAEAADTVFARRALRGDRRVKAGRYSVDVTSLDRVYWPEEGYTKADLLRYEWQVSEYKLPYLKDRPLILKRHPSGIAGPSFFQHDVNAVPGFVRTVRLESETGREIDYVIAGNLATLLYMANLGAIAQNPWHSRVGNLDCPDWVVFDLDPGKDVAFGAICELALAVKDVLDRLGLEACAKTSGSRGLHLYVPLRAANAYDAVAPFAEQVAARVAAENPRLATLERSLNKRPAGTIYVDHLQNARGKSMAAPYTVRARPGATVSTPLTWREVKRHVDPRDYTITTVPRRLGRLGDLFAPVRSKKQGLEQAQKRLARLQPLGA